MKTKSFIHFPLIFMLGVVVMASFGCNPHYISPNFESDTSGHKTIAIVPVEMHFTGKAPEKMTAEDVAKVETAESQAFQVSFYNEILRSTKNGRNPIRVDVQHYRQTLQLLESKGIDIRQSWKMEAGELSRILGVDAVVMARIEKNRLMSDLQSYGIDMATNVVLALSNNPLLPWALVSAQSKEVTADYTLVSGKDGATLWSISFKEGADWRQPANHIIDEISRRAAKKFPYRR